MVKIDLKDRKILYELDYNARMPLGELARRVRISKQNLNYRLRKLEEDGVISGYSTVINTHSLGYFSYRLYLRYLKVTEKREAEIISYFKNHENVIWFVSLSGEWDLEVVFLARNYIHFSNILKEIKENFKHNFSKYDISMSPVNYHFPRDYLLAKERKNFEYIYYGFEEKKIELDKEDIMILSSLSSDCKKTSVEIGNEVGKSYHTVKDRIKKLEQKKIIHAHRILIDVSKIEKMYYKILINLGSVSKVDQKEIFNFCSRRSFVVYFVEVLGNWDLEVEVEVDSEEEVVTFIRELRNQFINHIKDYSVIKVLKQHKLNYFPIGKRLQ